jgi:hypothetical protein
MQSENRAVSVNPKAMSYGNTEATRESGESVETARAALPVAGEDTVRASVKAEEAGGNDQPAVRGGNSTDRFEEEIAFNATPYVAAGRFQRLLSLNT